MAKRSCIVVSGLVVACVAGGADARASDGQAPFRVTRVVGDITVPPASTFRGSHADPKALAAMSCVNMSITASSVAKRPRPAGYTGVWNDPPVWQTTVATTGTWASGQCRYGLAVPPNQAFTLSAGAHGPFECSYVELQLTAPQSPSSGIPVGQTRVENATVTAVTCVVVA